MINKLYFPISIHFNESEETTNLNNSDPIFEYLLPGSLLESSDLQSNFHDDVIKLFYDAFSKKYFIFHGEFSDECVDFNILYETSDIYQFYKHYYMQVGNEISVKLPFDDPQKVYQNSLKEEQGKSGAQLIFTFVINGGDTYDNYDISYAVFIDIKDDSEMILYIVQNPGFEGSNSNHRAYMSGEKIEDIDSSGGRNEFLMQGKSWIEFFDTMNKEKSLINSSLCQKFFFGDYQIPVIEKIICDLIGDVYKIGEIFPVKELDRQTKALNEQLIKLKDHH